ncbi:MAG: hypothetical protein K5786_04405 [Treponema sp.]|nr:hypothetical protein [Treponema sp.]
MSLKEKLQKVLFAIKKMPTVKKRFFALISAFIVLNIVFIILLFSVRHRSVLCLEEYGSNLTSRLYALNAPAKKAFVKEYETADFKFNEDQKAIFSKIYNDFETVALTVRLEAVDSDFSEDSKFQFGYLTSEDFSSKGKLKENFLYNSRRILVQGKMSQASKSLDLSFALQKNDDIKKIIPEGFFVSASDCKLRILAACVVPAVLGYDCSSEVPFYGFACNGGIVQPGSKSFDFSGASMIFPVANSTKNTMPEFVVKLSEDPSLKASKERSVRAEIILGGEKFYVNNVALACEVRIPSAAMKAPFSRMDASNNSECLSGVLMRSTYLASPQVLVPIKTDPGLIVKYKSSAWRTLDYEIFEWDRFSKILFFDTRNYDVQDKFFRRMAFFVEKQGYKGRLLTNEELEGKHGYNAHDYSADSMAEFFNKASDLGFVLNYEEELLKLILIKNGLFEEDGEHVRSLGGGIVSISQESAEWLRTTLLAHEGWHTIFFRDEEFRNFVSAVYYTMDADSRQFLTDYFKSQPSLGYDVNDEYLMHNEFMAYIMQQKLSDVGNYFVHLAERGSVMRATPVLAAYIRETKGRAFEDAALAMNDYVYDKYGIICGNIALVAR